MLRPRRVASARPARLALAAGLAAGALVLTLPTHAASLYVTSSEHGRGHVRHYRIALDGTLQPVAEAALKMAPSGVALNHAGDGGVYVYGPQMPMVGQFAHDAGVLDPLEPFTAKLGAPIDHLVLHRMAQTTMAYALDRTSRELRVLHLDAQGQMHDAGQPRVTACPADAVLAAHPRRPFAYVLGDEPHGGRIDQFRLDPENGRPQLIGVSYLPWGARSPLALLIHPQHENAYVASRNYGAIARYHITARGDLAYAADDAELPRLWLPSAAAIGDGGRFLYAASNDDPNIVWWSIDPFSGSLEPAGMQPVEDAEGLTAIAAHPDLPWLYALDAANGRLYQFRIGPDGTPHPLAPDAVAVPNGSVAVDIAMTP